MSSACEFLLFMHILISIYNALAGSINQEIAPLNSAL